MTLKKLCEQYGILLEEAEIPERWAECSVLPPVRSVMDLVREEFERVWDDGE